MNDKMVNGNSMIATDSKQAANKNRDELRVEKRNYIFRYRTSQVNTRMSQEGLFWLGLLRAIHVSACSGSDKRESIICSLYLKENTSCFSGPM